MTYAEKINGHWVEKTPRKFLNEQNAAIPYAQLEAAGLFKITIAPRPVERVHKVITAGSIIEQNGRPVRDWIVEDLPVADVRAELHKSLAAYRWETETGGVDLAGSQIETTREAQAQISSTYSALKDGLVATVEWKAATGWLVLDLVDFTPIAQAVATHVQACFSAEKTVSIQIDALTDAELAGFDVVSAFDAAMTT